MVLIKCITFLISVIISISFITGLDLNNLDLQAKQKYVLQLLDHVTEPTTNNDIRNLSKSFSLENHAELYSSSEGDQINELKTTLQKMEDVRTFSAMKRKGVLDRGDVYCLFCEKQTAAAVAVFKILYGSKDFATFIITSGWLRQEISEMLFLYAFSVALRHRADCHGLTIPPIYETYPFFYLPKRTQQNIYYSIMASSSTDQIQLFLDTDVEQKTDQYSISYFTDDIGLNSFYYNFHIDYPFWMSDDVYGLNNNRRGELYIYVHRQLLARYNLERSSHKLCDIKPFNPTEIMEISLEGSVMFHNGWTLPDRSVHFNLYQQKYDLVKDLEYLEYQVRDAAYKGFYGTYDGAKLEIQDKGALEALGRRVFGNSRKPTDNAEQDIAFISRALFSSLLEKPNGFQLPTSTMQFYETSLRDPMFWKVQKYLITLINKMREKKPPYRRESLYFYGITILKIIVSRLETHFDPKYVDITNIFLNPNATDETKILYQTIALDHNPFNITLKIYCEKREESAIRIFLRSTQNCKQRYIDAEDDFESYVEIDAFTFKLNVGNNTVLRQSSEMNNVTPIQNITSEMKRKMETNNLNVTEYRKSFTGLPTNLILPRGSKYGLRLQMFVIVSPLEQKYLWENNVEYFKRKNLCRYTLCVDERPFGFPFDSKWEAGVTLYPNMKLSDVFVFHKN